MFYSALLSSNPSKDVNVFAELWEYMKDNWFTVDVGNYEHFSFGSGGMMSIRTMIIGICIGIIIAAIFSVFDRRAYGDFVRKILSEECLSPESAKTLGELGFERAHAVRSNLRSGNILRKYVRCVGAEEHYARMEAERAEYEEKNAGNKKAPKFRSEPYKYDFSVDRFYIREEEKYAADVKFEKQGSGFKSLLLVIVIAVVICALVCFILPDMLQLFDNFLGVIG